MKPNQRTMASGASALVAAMLTLPADAFTPNHLYVGGRDNVSNQAAVFEFDSAGTFIRKILTGDAGTYVYGVTFGPDGNLYGAVIGANKVIKIDSTNTVSTHLNAGSGLNGNINGVEFGPQGKLLVCSRVSGGNLKAFQPGGAVAKTYTAAAGLSPAFTTFGPDGHVFLTLTSAAGVIQELDANWNLVRTIGGGTFGSHPGNLLRGRNGVAYVADYSGDQVQRFDATGAALADLPVVNLNGPYGLAFGPDGNLHIANWDANTNQIIVANPNTGATVRTISHTDLESPTGMAFGPFRYQVRLKGTLNPDGAAQAKLAEAAGVLTFSPGSGKVMVTVAAAGSNNIAGSFPDTSALVFHGNDSAGSTKTTYAVQGASVSWASATRSVGSLTLSSKGSTNTNGFFVPKSISGAIQISRPGHVMNATFLTATKVP